MKKTITLLIFVMSILANYAQNKSVPEYLLNHEFPDSIKEFKIQNIKRVSVTFKEVLELHKGKKIVLDFWASWCKDCLEGLPKLQKLRRKTTNVDYVFLSLDKTAERWKNAIIKLNIEGDHYFMAEGWKNSLTNYIGLDWIPRYMILDEKGKVIYAKAIKVDADFKKLLLK